jgi:hypothetical protein
MRRNRIQRLHPFVATKELTLQLMEATYVIYGDVSTKNVIRLVSGPKLILKEQDVKDVMEKAKKTAVAPDINKLITTALVIAPALGTLFTAAKGASMAFKLSNFIRKNSIRTMGLITKGRESNLFEDWQNKTLRDLLLVDEKARNAAKSGDNATLEKMVSERMFAKLVDKTTNLSHKALGDMDPKLKIAIIAIALLIAGLPFGITQRIFNMVKKAVAFGFKAAVAIVKWLFTFIRHLLLGKSQGDIQKEIEDAKKEEEFLKSLEA